MLKAKSVLQTSQHRPTRGTSKHQLRAELLLTIIRTLARCDTVDDVYVDKRFEPSVDMRTGFVTKNILCVPIKTAKDAIIGVAQALNKLEGQFTAVDEELLVAIATQASVVLQNMSFAADIQRNRHQEMEFLNLVTNVTSEIDLKVVLNKLVSEVTRMLNADRSTLFLNDEKTNELFTEVGEGLGATQIRIPNHIGIAGSVFTTGQTINIPHAYADMRFNPATDKRTGYFTRSMLCVPVTNKSGKIIGVTQALNKVGGPFTAEDEARLHAFTAQWASRDLLQPDVRPRRESTSYNHQAWVTWALLAR